MSGMKFESWMSDADGMMFNIERDPVLRSTILSVWVLDRAPDEARFAETLRESVAVIPRLRQRVVSDPLGLAPPRWETDPDFDPGYHVRKLHLGGEGSLRDLLDLATPIAMQAFDRDRPLWELYQVDGLAGGKSGVIMKLHHALSDGVGMVRMTETLVERDREGTRRRRAAPVEASDADDAPATSTLERLRRALGRRIELDAAQRQQFAGAVGRGTGQLLRDPVGAVRQVRDTVTSIARLLRPVREPLSPVMDKRSMGVDLNGFTVSVDELKRASKVAGGTLNDAFVAGVAGGLARYHEHSGKPVPALRMNMPVNIRDGENADRAGNQFAPARFTVPMDIADPVERMKAVHALVQEQRDEPALPLVDTVTSVIARFGVAASVALASGMMKAMDFTTSNVPGPRFPVYASGAKIEHMFPFGPTAGAAVNVTLFSYDGQCHVGVNSNRGAVADPDLLLECLQKGMADVVGVG